MIVTQKPKRISWIASFLAIALFLFPTIAQAATLQELQEQQRKAAEDAAKYRALQQQKHTEAEQLDAQRKRVEQNITFVETSLQLTSTKIHQKESDISSTSKEIENKSARLSELQQKQNEAIVEIYQLGTPSPVEMLASAPTFSAFEDQKQFIEAIKNHLEDLANEVNAAKEELQHKKSDLEKQRNDLSSLQNQQEAQKTGLESEKKQKEVLLTQTTKQEKTYDQLADEAEARKQEFDRQVAAALRARKSSGGVVVKGNVKQGDVIGYMGSTGYSTGPHLHFSVLRDGDYINPRGAMGGALQWPFDSFYVSQEFGRPSWAAKYAFHNGIDMISNSGYGAPVQAACTGKTIEPFPNYNGWMPGGYGHYVVIECNNGLWTLYGHLIR